MREQTEDKMRQKHQHAKEMKISVPKIDAGILDILDGFPSYVMLVDAEHHILLANKAVSKELGVNQEDLVGRYCPMVIHGLSEPFPGCPLEEAVKRGDAVERELFDQKYGQWTKAEVYPTRYRTQDGQVVYLHMVHDITKKKLTEEELKHNYDTQTVLNKLLQLSLENMSTGELLELAIDFILSITWLAFENRGGIFLVEDESKFLVLKAQRKLAKPIQEACARIPFGKCLCGRAALTQEIQFADHIDEHHETRYDGIIPHGHYCVPILYAGKTLGVLNVYLQEGRGSKQSEKNFLTAIANTLAGIIIRKQAGEELKESLNKLQKTLEDTVDALALMGEMRDPYTAGHQRRVASLVTAIAKEMGLPEEQIQAIHIAGYIHDIGKICIPAEILSKPGRLNEVEFNMIKMHSQAGHNILKNIEFPWSIDQIVLQHHERMDGSGYPIGLSGEGILLEARIIAVADVVEAMSSHRPYRPALGRGAALEEITKNAGKLYDTEVVDACIRVFHEKGFHFDE